MAGVTIAALTGTDNAPNKANEAKQKNDIGAARDQVYLFASNAQTEAYERIYVKGKQATANADVTAGNASTEVSKYVKDKIDKEYGNAKTVGLATIVSTNGGASVTISTTDWKQEGTVSSTGGTLTWKALTENTSTPPGDVTPLEIGDTVNYSTTLNGETLDEWKVFLSDKDYTYIILDGYLSNSSINLTNIEKDGNYSVYTYQDRATLVNAMLNTANWNTLLTGTLNGTSIDYSQPDDTNVCAMGAPTLELWVSSWNQSYPSNKIYLAKTSTVMDDGLYGDYLGDSVNPEEDESYGISWGINNTAYENEVFFPYNQNIDDGNCHGYWLASYSAGDYEYITDITGYYNYNYNNNPYCWSIGGQYYGDSGVAFRPIVCLPTSILN